MHDLDFKETKTKLEMAVVNGWGVFAGRCHTTIRIKDHYKCHSDIRYMKYSEKKIYIYMYIVSEALNIYSRMLTKTMEILSNEHTNYYIFLV